VRNAIISDFPILNLKSTIDNQSSISNSSSTQDSLCLRASVLKYQELKEMIRKLAAGGYRLYSRKKNPKTGKRRNLGTFKSRKAGGPVL
jgi:hypothetical protein